MLEFSPFFELLSGLPVPSLRRAAQHYRELADRLDYEAWRREPQSERAAEIKNRVAKVNAAVDSAARAIASGEPRQAAVSRAAGAAGVEIEVVDAWLAHGKRRLREERSAAAAELAKAGMSDAEIATELRKKGFAASLATVTRDLRRRAPSPLAGGSVARPQNP